MLAIIGLLLIVAVIAVPGWLWWRSLTRLNAYTLNKWGMEAFGFGAGFVAFIGGATYTIAILIGLCSWDQPGGPDSTIHTAIVASVWMGLWSLHYFKSIRQKSDEQTAWMYIRVFWFSAAAFTAMLAAVAILIFALYIMKDMKEEKRRQLINSILYPRQKSGYEERIGRLYD